MKKLIIVVLAMALAFTFIHGVNAANSDDTVSDVVNSDYTKSDTVVSDYTWFHLIDYYESSADNIITNSKFEDIDGDGLPDGWDFDTYYSDVSSVNVEETTEASSLTDNVCLHISSESENDAKLVQTVKVKKYSYIRLSCVICTSGDGTGSISILDYYDARSNVVSSDDWQIARLFIYTGDVDTITVALRLGYYGELVSGEAWFDSVQLVELDYIPDDCYMLHSNSSVQGNQSSDDNDTDMPFFANTITALVLTAFVFVIIMLYIRYNKQEPKFSNSSNSKMALILIMAAGLILRVVANFVFKSLKDTFGHSTDIRCFISWGNRVYSNGPANFYAPEYFADYPPGYMWILGICAWITKVFGITGGSAAEALIFKLPSIICDLASAYLVYKIAVRSGRTHRSAILFASMIIFNPLVIFISSVWGQIDIILTLFVCLGYLWFIFGAENDNYKDMAISGLMYGIAVALKPQALMMGPLYATAFIINIVRKIKQNHNIKKSVMAMFIAAACAFAVIIIPALPFTGSQKGLWLVEKYLSTASSYDYATIEAYNLYGFLGANWTDANNPFIGSITYKQFGSFCMCVVIAVSIAVLVLESKRNKGAIFLSSGFLITGIFTLGHYMHERYLFPALLFLVLASLMYNDRRILIAFAGVTISMLYNAIGAFLIIDYPSARYVSYPNFMKIGSMLTLIIFVYLTYVVFSVVFQKPNGKYSLFRNEREKGDNV